VYLKPSMTGDEPQDVLEYFRRIRDFPHQTTADQWFDESQFESYRKLGMHIGEEAFCRFHHDDTQPLGDIEQLFARLHMHWYRPSTAISDNSTTHVMEYTRILEVIRTNPALGQLDYTLFDGAREPLARVDPRDEFYVCNALIQLIENVYADLDLEHLWNHPHVQGWMNVFVHWAQQPAFRRAWQRAQWTYADRFRNFYNDRLRGRAIALPPAFIASHRGRGVDRNENTIDAFREAVQRGANVIELDVHRTADGHLLVWHDEYLAGYEFARLTLTEVRLNQPYRLPTLRECAAELRDLVQLDIELKDEDTEQAVIETMLAEPHVWRRRDFVLTSFHRSMLEAVRRCDRYVRTGLLVSDKDAFRAALRDFVDLRADFIGPAHTLVDDYEPPDASAADRARARFARTMLQTAIKENVPLVPWSDSSDDLDQALKEEKENRLAFLLCERAVVGIITDDVAAALRVKRTL
jgi:glycerophosphoryl diester phosphodiesterase